MSGIAGIWRQDGRPVAREDLEKMSAALAHRGPRASGLFVDGPFGCVVRASEAFEPETRAPLPLVDEELVVACDARIDARRMSARAAGLDEGACSDAELVRALARREGRSFARALVGDFALALYERRTGALVLARDHVGARPLVVVVRPRFVAFASEVGALLALDEVPRALDLTRIADFLVDARLEASDRERTFFAHIERVPAGHTLVLEGGARRLTAHWSPRLALDPRRGARDARDDDAHVARFRDVFIDAVGDRARGPHAAAMLSGGVDSSSIVAAARLTRAGSLGVYASTWAMRAEDDDCPDRPFIDEVIAAGGVIATRLTPDDTERVIDDVRALVTSCTDPYDAYLAALPLPLWLRARDDGVRTMTTGIDGDLVLSLGGDGVRRALATWRLGLALDTARGLARHHDTTTTDVLMRHGLVARARSLARAALPSLVVDGRRAALHDRAAREAVRRAPLTPAFARASGVAGRLARTLGAPWRDRDDDDDVHTAHAARISWPILQSACERYDRVAARAGITPTHPILDRRVLEAVLALPLETLVAGGAPKSVLRRAFGSELPARVAARPQSPAPAWPFVVRAARALLPDLEARFAAPLARLDALLDGALLRASLARFKAGHDDEVNALFRAYVAISLLERFA